MISNRTTHIALTVISVIAFSLAVIGHADKTTTSAPVTYRTVDFSPVASPQAQPSSGNATSDTVFVGSIVTNYKGNRFEVTQDGTLVPIAE